ncbi:FAD-dependent monooxygenase [Streptomyces sp. NPDC056411]|uniref:FAD-dependent monooxygenase n=1 Tax=Streptomyces sp. NPDC056411 TaxID=3345813 RepID=UPI0035DEF6F1
MPKTQSEQRIPVLIAGGGTVGLSAALFLAHHGVECLAVERQDGPSRHPRATGLGPRTVEFLRETGIAEAVDAVAIDMSAGGLGKISVTTLAEADLPALARATPAHARPGRQRTDRTSPGTLRGTCPQNRLDAVLLSAARDRGATVRHATRLVSFEQDTEGVTALLDGPDGPHTVRADYLLAADGVRSGVRDALGIGASGPGNLGTPMINMLFRADLTPYTRGQSFVICDITHPDAPGILLTIDGDQEWIFHTSYDPDGGESADDFTPARCRALIRTAIGAPDLDVEVVSTLPWRPRGLLADRFRDGRVFLMGDAAHTNPPLGAFGLNTGIADAHNLAWKLAAVLSGQAGAGLLDSYAAERRPVGALALEQSLRRLADPRLHWDLSPRLAEARAAAGVLNAPLVHMGYRYDSAAVIDPQPELPSPEDLTVALDGAPGSRLPHLWVERDGHRLSTLDLVGSRFTLLTGAGAGGDRWVRAAREAGERLGLELPAYRIGPGAEVTDPDGRWPQFTGPDGGGALLVRPDQFIGWRSAAPSGGPSDPSDASTSHLTESSAPSDASTSHLPEPSAPSDDPSGDLVRALLRILAREDQGERGGRTGATRVA